MSTETIKDTRLFTDIQGGRIVCFDHLGGYGKAEVDAHPGGTGREPDGRPTWRTPLDVWMVMTKEDRVAFAASMVAYGYFGLMASCEDCGYNPDARPQS